MTTILIRIMIVYAIMILAVRLMGKRQIGELEVSDLVTTILISEIAVLPITDRSVPISHAIIPMVVVVCFEVISAALTVLFPRLKNIFTARPSTLIKNGSFCRASLLESRISNDELMSELRQNGYVDVDEVMYAILEKNGKITIIPKAKYTAPNCEQMGISPQEKGIFHIVVDNGVLNAHGLCEVSLNPKHFRRMLQQKGISLSDIYLMMINDVGEERLILKEDML